MKKIIQGKLYDTTTAKALGTWQNAGSWSDFNHMEETLYRKRTGEFFLMGEGGPMTKYAVSVEQNSWIGGSKIIPITAANARKWAEDHLSADEYAAIFGLPSEGDDERATLCVQLPAALVARIRANAADAAQSVTAYLEALLTDALP